MQGAAVRLQADVPDPNCPGLQRGLRDTKTARCLRSRFTSEQIGGSGSANSTQPSLG